MSGLASTHKNGNKSPTEVPETSDDDEFAKNATFIGLSFVLLVLILLMYAWIMRQWLLNPQMSNERIILYLAGLVVAAIVMCMGLIRLFQLFFPPYVPKQKKE